MRCYIAYFQSTLLIKVVLTSNGTGNGTHGIQKQVELQDVQFTGHYLEGDFDETICFSYDGGLAVPGTAAWPRGLRQGRKDPARRGGRGRRRAAPGYRP